MKQKSNFALAPLLLLSGLLAVLISGCGDSAENKTETAPEGSHEEGVVLTPETIKEVGIEIGTPQRTILRQSFIARGQVMVNPDYVAHLNSLVSGRVRKIYVQIGDYVREGDPLFELESLEIANITADYIRAKAEFDLQQANYERIRKLRDEDIKAEKDLIEAKAKLERARAELKAAADRKLHSLGFSDEEVENMVGEGGHRRGLLIVKSPIDGYVTERNIELGQLVQPDTDIMKVIDNTRIWVEADVYEKDYANLKIGQSANVTAAALPDKSFSGKVLKINKELDSKSRTFTVFVELKEGKSEMIPNMFTTVEFYYGTPDSILVVPDAAVQFDGANYYVFVESAPHRFERKAVTLGAQSDSLVQIAQGLGAAEKIVLRNAFFVKSEMEKESFGE